MTIQADLAARGKTYVARDLDKPENAFNGILFDDEIRRTMTQPQRFTGKPPKGKK